MLVDMSNERLDDQIAARYQEAHRVAPGVVLSEGKDNILGALWGEFDARVADGRVEVE